MGQICNMENPRKPLIVNKLVCSLAPINSLIFF